MQHPRLQTNYSLGSECDHSSSILLMSSLHLSVLARNLGSVDNRLYSCKLASSSWRAKSITLMLDWEAQTLHQVNLVISAMMFLQSEYSFQQVRFQLAHFVSWHQRWDYFWWDYQIYLQSLNLRLWVICGPICARIYLTQFQVVSSLCLSLESRAVRFHLRYLRRNQPSRATLNNPAAIFTNKFISTFFIMYTYTPIAATTTSSNAFSTVVLLEVFFIACSVQFFSLLMALRVVSASLIMLSKLLNFFSCSNRPIIKASDNDTTVMMQSKYWWWQSFRVYFCRVDKFICESDYIFYILYLQDLDYFWHFISGILVYNG